MTFLYKIKRKVFYWLYKYHFFELNLIKAYKYRYIYLSLKCNKLVHDRFYHEYKLYQNHFFSEKHKKNLIISDNVKKIYIIGPAYDSKNINIDPDREIILFKPDDQLCNLIGRPCTLFLNSDSYLNDYESIVSAINDSRYNKIYVRDRIDSLNGKVSRIIESKEFPSLLAFNRLINHYLATYQKIDIRTQGINYYIGNILYNNNYPYPLSKKDNFLIKNVRNNKAIIRNLFNHDILLNFMYTYSMLNKFIIIDSHDELYKILSMDNKEYLAELMNSLK